jgi:hypothetical protein
MTSLLSFDDSKLHPKQRQTVHLLDFFVNRVGVTVGTELLEF